MSQLLIIVNLLSGSLGILATAGTFTRYARVASRAALMLFTVYLVSWGVALRVIWP